MVPSSCLCQLFIRLKRISRPVTLASSHLWVLLGLSCCFTGCWQEIQYKPSQAAKSDAASVHSGSNSQPEASTDEPEFEPVTVQTNGASEVAPSESTASENFVTPETPVQTSLARDPSNPENSNLETSATEPATKSEVGQPQPELVPPTELANDPDAIFGSSDRYAKADEPASTQPILPPSTYTAAPAPTIPSPSISDSRSALAAWRMTSEWSMAVALQAKGQPSERFGKRLELAEQEAETLDISLPALPELAADADLLAANLSYLLEDAGPGLTSELNEKYGATHAALAELATKTHVLLLSYVPTSTQLDSVIAAIERAAMTSGLPESVWGELRDLLAERASFKTVKSAIFRLHNQASAQLAKTSEF